MTKAILMEHGVDFEEFDEEVSLVFQSLGTTEDIIDFFSHQFLMNTSVVSLVHRTPSSGRGAISIRIMLYVGWGKDGHIDGFYMRGFECEKFHSE